MKPLIKKENILIIIILLFLIAPLYIVAYNYFEEKIKSKMHKVIYTFSNSETKVINNVKFVLEPLEIFI